MIGGKSYDDYLREQERKNRTYGYETRDAFRSQTEVAEKTQTSSPKKSVPVEGIFLTVFGGVFFLFGMFFIFILHSVLPSDESAMLLVYLGPGIFVVVGLVILSVGIYSLATRRPVGKLVINGVPVGENDEEDEQDPGRDRES
ncbi:MAG: hypothetical protein II805_00220 [Candidatus Methanomethylophilus sp.]|nr:hypothetical protein [Methanomethylophilus sp.]